LGRNMGIGVLGGADVCIKRKFRWMFYIDNVVGEGMNMLPPDKAGRPSLSFKEIEAQHLNETIYFAGKPDWKPIQVTLVDLKTSKSPVFEWLKNQYDPCDDKGTWKRPGQMWKRDIRLEMYDGCGEVVEKWIMRNAWPNNIEWSDLDMSQSDYCVIDVTMRYDRAWIEGC